MPDDVKFKYCTNEVIPDGRENVVDNDIPHKKVVRKFTKEQLTGIIDYAHKYDVDIAEMIPGLFD